MQKKGFSLFGWSLAFFCLPSALWPLALLVSSAFSDNTHLTSFQIDYFSILFWIYPFVLLLVSGGLYRLYRQHKRLAVVCLIFAFLIFYTLVFYIVSQLIQ
ncbi:hypothetical protein EV693_1156 [Nicoletella semolina]|uniref:Uncharacterized protein n=1 Tax=Nicoletella semolina TaxID=271160 RepID=A0A4R2N567_9PAST|nr:DUF5389 family protein [Nicoletella semolina]TCP15974.1 hypothetical protein EV693_1156 [Nicoletella semolina]